MTRSVTVALVALSLAACGAEGDGILTEDEAVWLGRYVGDDTRSVFDCETGASIGDGGPDSGAIEVVDRGGSLAIVSPLYSCDLRLVVTEPGRARVDGRSCDGHEYADGRATLRDDRITVVVIDRHNGRTGCAESVRNFVGARD